MVDNSLLKLNYKWYIPDECESYHLFHLDSKEFLMNSVAKELNVEYLSKFKGNEYPITVEGKPFCPHNLFIASIPISQKKNSNHNNNIYNAFFIIDPLMPFSLLSVDLLESLGFNIKEEIDLFGSLGFTFGKRSNLQYVNILGLYEITHCFEEMIFDYFINPPTLKMMFKRDFS